MSRRVANQLVRAKQYYTIADDGLSQHWSGNIWLNPPYSSKLISRFVHNLRDSYLYGDVSQAIVLVNNATETRWFDTLIEIASAIVFPHGKVKFLVPDIKKSRQRRRDAGFIGATGRD